MMIGPMVKLLIGAGSLLIFAALALLLLSKLGLTRLPGDVVIQRGRFTFFFPIVTCLVLSLVLSLAMSLLARWRR